MTIEEFYIQKWGVCPGIEKEVALHSYYDMIKFAEQFSQIKIKEALQNVSQKSFEVKSGATGEMIELVNKQSILDYIKNGI